jgi:EAL domain-containing protein (putative c-di-GMP-specific phosphodiesterase class I)/GGDEF domain-containing protein
MFPKTRSWFALGAPLELLSPLSVLRILFALDMLAWPIEGLVLRWPTHKLGWLIGATVVAVAVWVALRSPRAVSRRWCHLLALLANILVISVAYAGTTLGPVLAAVVFLLPVASFVALFLGWKAVFGHQAVVTAGLGLVLAGPLHLGSAVLVDVLASLMLVAASMTIQLLVASVWSRGAVDPDTGLPNGVGLSRRLGPLVAEGGPPEDAGDATGPLMLATVLLGGIEEARQALGYNVGIELLRRAVEDLGQVVPADTLIARVEADELVIARRLSSTAGAGKPGASPDVAGTVPEDVLLAGQTLAADLARSIAAGRYLVDGIEVMLRAHIGLVFAPWDGIEVPELVRRASLNARRAAHDGVTTALWDGDRDAMTGEDLALLADLRLAVERDELWLAYQPQVVADGAKVVSVEALLRWDSPVHGSVPPGRFIILAERTGLIDRLTEWVLHQALDAQVRWRAKGVELPVSVNLSAKTLGRPELAAWILAQLDVRQLPTSALTVEVTETAAADLLAAVHLLSPLHNSGVRVSIDDFGTGYTSLAAIPYLPLDEIKVDMQFVKRAPTSAADEAIVRCVHELAHRLGLVTVAEGVEDEVVRDLMVEIDFDLLQGYHYSKGLPETELMSFIEKPNATPTARVPRAPLALDRDSEVVVAAQGETVDGLAHQAEPA